MIFAYVDKNSAMQFVQTFVALCANAFDVRVKCLHSDGEFKGHKDLDATCAQAGIIQEFSTRETPQVNGEAARALCYGANVPAHLWEHAMHYYVYVHNLTPREVLDGKTPWKVFTKRPSPSLPKLYFRKHVMRSEGKPRLQSRLIHLGKCNCRVKRHGI